MQKIRSFFTFYEEGSYDLHLEFVIQIKTGSKQASTMRIGYYYDFEFIKLLLRNFSKCQFWLLCLKPYWQPLSLSLSLPLSLSVFFFCKDQLAADELWCQIISATFMYFTDLFLYKGWSFVFYRMKLNINLFVFYYLLYNFKSL